MDVALDTSALSNLERDRAALGKFRQILAKEGLRLVLPYLTIIEALATADPQAAKQRADLILELNGRDFIVGGDLSSIIAIELRRKGPRLERTPRLADKHASRVLDLLTNPRFVEYHHRVVDELERFLNKSEQLDHDRQVRDHAERTFSSPSTEDLDELMRGACMKALNDSPFINYWTGSKRKQRHIRFNPAKRPCVTSWCVQAYLNAMGNIHAKFHFGRHSEILSGPKRNTWVDTAIAAAASYSRYFVTDDIRQARRLNFVSTELGLGVRAVTLSEFLGKRRP